MSQTAYTFAIEALPPYDFDLTVKRLHGVRHEAYCGNTRSVTRTLRLPSGAVALAVVTSEGTKEAPLLRVHAYGAVRESDRLFIRKELARTLSADADLRPFYSHASQDPVLARLCRSLYGLRIMLEGSLFECMVKTILGQQMNLAFAATLNKRLMERASEPFLHEGKAYPVFPSPEAVASLSYEDLTALQFSRRKAEYVIDFARRVADGRLDLEELQAMDDSAIMTKLTAIRGIGRWTVECFLLFGMGRPDLLPAADIGLRNAIRHRYGLTSQPSENEVRSIGAQWSPWSSYATFYLWESLNQQVSP